MKKLLLILMCLSLVGCASAMKTRLTTLKEKNKHTQELKVSGTIEEVRESIIEITQELSLMHRTELDKDDFMFIDMGTARRYRQGFFYQLLGGADSKCYA